jgi:hypothetical protein
VLLVRLRRSNTTDTFVCQNVCLGIRKFTQPYILNCISPFLKLVAGLIGPHTAVMQPPTLFCLLICVAEISRAFKGLVVSEVFLFSFYPQRLHTKADMTSEPGLRNECIVLNQTAIVCFFCMVINYTYCI